MRPESRTFLRMITWRYKTNALNAMLNDYELDYLPIIKAACDDEYFEVRDMTKWVIEEIQKKSES